MKVLQLLKKDISFQLIDILNLLATTGAFPTNFKTVKVMPVHKKNQNLTSPTIDLYRFYKI